jgi:shikimate kinase
MTNLLTSSAPKANMPRAAIRAAIGTELSEIEARLDQAKKAHRGGVDKIRAELDLAEREARSLTGALDDPTCCSYGHIRFSD